MERKYGLPGYVRAKIGYYEKHGYFLSPAGDEWDFTETARLSIPLQSVQGITHNCKESARNLQQLYSLSTSVV